MGVTEVLGRGDIAQDWHPKAIHHLSLSLSEHPMDRQKFPKESHKTNAGTPGA